LSAARPAIVVVNYGSSSLLAENLSASSSGEEIVVVVDNWYSPQEREAVLRLGDRHGWHVVTSDVNAGFGTGMNIGVDRARRAGATSLLLLNPDARIDPADVMRLIDQVEIHRGLLLAPRIVRPDGVPWMSGTMDLRLADGTVGSSRRRPHGAEVMIWVSGAVMAMSAELWERIGGFDDDYFLYWEDIDLCRRVHEVGGEVRVDESVVAVHDEGGTHADGGGRAKSETFYYYNIRNRAVYASKWLSQSNRRRWNWTTPRTAKAVLYSGGRRQFVQSIKPWRGFVRGVIASYLVSIQGRSLDAPPSERRNASK
jgi:N-acetylglucosaminyl-diphospho-decaprenol L-rhamnosyltransferase